MKIHNILSGLVLVLLMIASIACEKDTIVPGISDPRPDTPPVPVVLPIAGEPPHAFTIGDQLVEFPNETFLGGGYSEKTNIVTSFKWAKISGPDSYVLEYEDSLMTKLSGLQKGIYEFELTVYDEKGLYSKDTMKVTVGQMSTPPRNILFENLVWTQGDGLLWGTIIEVKNIYHYLPAGNIFKVYLQSKSLTDWTEIVPNSQVQNAIQGVLYIMDGNLSVWSSNEELGMARVKIVY